MATLKPFKAIRPRRDLAHLIASRPVATYTPEILAAKLEDNPFTFIHIIHPEYFEKKGNKTEPNTPERFAKVKNKFNEFYDNGFFVEETEPALYVYRQTKGDRVFSGVICGASVEEYKSNKIKKHEATLTSREEMFTNYLDIVGLNAEPVLLCHEHSIDVEDLLKKIMNDRPEYEFTTADAIKHELWVVQGETMTELQSGYATIPHSYIADGHHRSASSLRLADRINERGNTENDVHNYFLSYFISEKELQILPFNRICKDLNGLSSAAFLYQLKNDFEVTSLSKAQAPDQLHQINCYLDGKWYALTSKDKILQGLSPVGEIDAEILTKHILSPILGIHDLKTDKNIKFVSGEKGISPIEQEVDRGVYKVGFALYPVTVEQLKNVANADSIMPPKSTWIAPKMRSGLTIYKIKE